MRTRSRAKNDHRSQKNSTIIFPIAPEPFEDESPISWVQRLCGAHHCTYPKLRSLIGEIPPKNDWDSPNAVAALDEICKLTDQKSIPCSLAIRGYQALAKAAAHDEWQLLIHKSPTYKWCPECWRNDAVPYLRWGWRVSRLGLCNIHQTELVKSCPWCDSPMMIKRSLLTTSGAFAGVPNLSYCCKCGLPMADPDLGTIKKTQRTMKDFFWESWCFLDQQVQDIQTKISVLREQMSREENSTWQLIEDLELHKKKLMRTEKSAHLFLEQFLSDKAVPI